LHRLKPYIAQYLAFTLSVLFRDFNAGLSEAEVRLIVRNLAHFHAASMVLPWHRSLDLASHYRPLFASSDVEGEGMGCGQRIRKAKIDV